MVICPSSPEELDAIAANFPGVARHMYKPTWRILIRGLANFNLGTGQHYSGPLLNLCTDVGLR